MRVRHAVTLVFALIAALMVPAHLSAQAFPAGDVRILVSRHPVIYGSQLPDVEPASPAPALGEHSAEVVRDWLNA